MNNFKAQSAGGKATAIIERKQALERYYSNPNYCIYCGKIIEIKENQKVRDVKIKKYCDSHCATLKNNEIRANKPKKIKKPKEKNEPEILNRTKGELFSSRSNWQSARSSIRVDANRTYLKYYPEKKCIVCNYVTHVEICHKKSVSDFPDTALIKEINDIDNLVGLCPNHHWEFDKGLLKL